METLTRILFGDIVDPIEQLRDAMYSALLGALLTFVAGLVAYYGGATSNVGEVAGFIGVGSLSSFAANLRRR
jgi:class 3 adenylate cyclase